MKEEEWLTTSDYTKLLRFVHARTTIRQARLCMVAACRLKAALLVDPRNTRILEAAETCADTPDAEVAINDYQERWHSRVAPLTDSGGWQWLYHAIADADKQLDDCRKEETWDGTRHYTPGAAMAHAVYMSVREDPLEAFTGGEGDAVHYCNCLIDRAGVLALREKPGQSLFEIDQAKERIQLELADVLREIFGNPFRPIPFSPAWRTDTAIALARTMYESRDFSAMPILADALQDAGCDNDAILSHCRNTSLTHVRGCWVVDLVLCKS